jgi:type I site-specific restriction endonuclease
LITPKLLAAGWDTEPHVLSEQRPITDGRIIPVGMRYKRKAPKKPDHLLSYRHDTTLAVIEAMEKLWLWSFVSFLIGIAVGWGHYRHDDGK